MAGRQQLWRLINSINYAQVYYSNTRVGESRCGWERGTKSGAGVGDGVANLRISMDFSICAFSNIFESREQQRQQQQEQEQKSTLECAQQLLPGLNMQRGFTKARAG